MRCLLLKHDNKFTLNRIVSKALMVDFSTLSGRQRSLCSRSHLIQMDSLVECCT